MSEIIPEIGLRIGGDMTLEIHEWSEAAGRDLYRAKVTQPTCGGDDRLVVSITIRGSDLHALPVVAKALIGHKRARAKERAKTGPAEAWEYYVEKGA